MIRHATLLASALALLPLASNAQTLLGHAGGAATVFETTGPPVGPCLYPTGPIVGVFPTLQAFPCPTPGAPIAPLAGDVAVNRVTNTSWVTDGMFISGYTPAGVVFNSFLALGPVLPAPLTGLGFDGPGGVLWATDGALVTGVTPPAAGCFPGPAAVVFPPFPIGPLAGPATDIDWDPTTGLLWVCDAGGLVSNWFPGGLPGPFPPFVVPAFCPLGPLTGIAVDSGASAALPPTVLWVTDGAMIAYVMTPPPLPGPAPLTFHTTVPCQPTVAPLTGLAMTARPIAYGFGADTTAAPAPVLGAIGQTVVPNPGFAFTVTGSVPGSTALVYASVGPLCPPFFLYGVLPLQILPAPLFFVGAMPIGAGGAGALAVPIAPGGLGLGVMYTVQSFVLTPIPSFQITNALEFTGNMP